MRVSILFCCVASMVALDCIADEGTMMVQVDGTDLIAYQAMPLIRPKGGEKFRGSNFIHPLKTPSGFVVTEIQPGDHLHHFGLWWPWKHVEVEGRTILCWEMQQGDGIIRARGGKTTSDGFTGKSVYVDRKYGQGERVVLNETLNAKVSKIRERPVRGYHLDLEIVHETAIDKPVTVTTYRYSGFSLRGTPAWDKDNSSVMTSEGKAYDKANFTRARWVKIEGAADNGASAGVLLMSHPGNRDHPELLRTWNPQTQNGAIFVNFNTVQEKPWVMMPGGKYVRNYRVLVYDGALSMEDAERMWKSYRAATK